MALRSAVITISFLGTALAALPVTSGLAHTTEVAGDVAGTWHVEPNHTPKAGEPATVWIALTRKGGSILPLDRAECELGVYSLPRRPEDEPVLQPPLQAIAVERYQGIPGAEVIFPKTGLYELELACTPKVKEDFTSFQILYQLTVASGSPRAEAKASPQLETATAPSTVTASPTPDAKANQPNSFPVMWMGAIAATAILGLGLLNVTLRK